MATELPQLRALLHYHCGSPTLRTRQLMIDLQAPMNHPPFLQRTALSVNVNKVALLCNTRHLAFQRHPRG